MKNSIKAPKDIQFAFDKQDANGSSVSKEIMEKNETKANVKILSEKMYVSNIQPLITSIRNY